MLADDGIAQVLATFDVQEDDGDWQGVVLRRVPSAKNWRISGHLNPDSPFALSRDAVATRHLPPGSLLINHPSKKAAFFERLASQRVVECVSVTLTIQHRMAPSEG